MPATVPENPYDDEHVAEYPLGRAPLVRVLAQVRHPSLLALTGDGAQDTAVRVAQRLVAQYPIFDSGREVGFSLTPSGVKEIKGGSSNIWRLRNSDETWQISFSSEFLSIETSSYVGRTHFLERLGEALTAYGDEIKPPSATRVGVRYTNRIADASQLERLSTLIRPELWGPVATKLPTDVEIAHAISQTEFKTNDGGSLLNWGLLPPNGTFDSTLPPVSSTSWYLDIDAFSTLRTAFTCNVVGEVALTLATRAYAHFRWCVTDDFLSAFREA